MRTPRPRRPSTPRSRKPLSLEALERRLVMTGGAQPVASLTAPPQALIGEPVDLSVGFSNASPTQTGYGPYIDLYLPAAGADGNDGVSFGGATYLGAAVSSTVLTFNASGQATHPFAENSSGNHLVLTGRPGDQVAVLSLPFGSFTPGQPQADVQVTANLSNLADVGTPLAIKADAGFRYGNDPLDDPTTDPTIVGASTSSSLTPELFTVTKTYVGPEQETATGPDFPRQYRVDVERRPRPDDHQRLDIMPKPCRTTCNSSR